MNKLKRYRIIASSIEAEKKVKVESVCCVEIIGGLECHLELVTSKKGKFLCKD